MRIGLVAPLGSVIARERAASIETLVWVTARDLTKLGHDVTVFGAAGSTVPDGTAFVATMPGPYGHNGSPEDWRACEWMNLCTAVARSSEFDVMHAHSYLWSLPLIPLAQCITVHTTHVFPYDEEAAMWRLHPGANVTAISGMQWQRYPDLHPIAVIPHGIDIDDHTFRAIPDDYVCWLGTFQPAKGALEAIAAAKAYGVHLKLAGPQSDYFDETVRPLVDGRHVEYVGWVGPEERDELLGGARALLYPIQVEEPFGLVLVEALMSGTPVAAYRLGAVEEIIEPGVTGAYVELDASLTPAIDACLGLDRMVVRAAAESRYSAHRMTLQYAKLYADLCRGS